MKPVNLSFFGYHFFSARQAPGLTHFQSEHQTIWSLVSTAVWEGVTYKNTHLHTIVWQYQSAVQRVFLDMSTLWRRTDGVQKVPCLTSPCLSVSLCWLCRPCCTACRAVQMNFVHKDSYSVMHWWANHISLTHTQRKRKKR